MTAPLFVVTATRPVTSREWSALMEAADQLDTGHGIGLLIKGMTVKGPLTLPGGATLRLAKDALVLTTPEPEHCRHCPEGCLGLAHVQPCEQCEQFPEGGP